MAEHSFFKSVLRKKSPHVLKQTVSNSVRTLGPIQLIILGIGCVVGAGLFALTGVAAGQYAGPGVAISFALAAIACCFVGLCYSEMASTFPNAGGSAYSYSYTALGELPAFLTGWAIMLQYLITIAAVASSWSSYTAALLKQWGIILDPRFLMTPGTEVTMPNGEIAHAFLNLPAMLVVIAVILLLFMGVKESAKINSVLVAIKLIVIVGFIGFVTPHVRLENFSPLVPPSTGTFGEFGWSGIARATAMLFMAYNGFDAVAMAARETKNPQKNLPIGILGTLLICGLIFILFALVLVGSVNYKDMLTELSPVSAAIALTGMPWLNTVLSGGIIIGFLAVIYAATLAVSSTLVSMSEDRLLPKFLSNETKKTKAPYCALITVAVICSLLGGLLPLASLGNLSAIGVVVVFTLVCVATGRLRNLHPDLERPFMVKGHPWLIPGLGAISCLIVMAMFDLETWEGFLLWSAIGAVCYFAYGRKRSHLHKKQ